MRATLIDYLYWTLQALAFPFLLLYLALRIVRNRAYASRVTERFGFLPRSLHRTLPGAIWLHAVSVGEAITAAGLLQRLRAQMPHTPIYVSCTTLAGLAMAEQKLAHLAAGIFYAPIDYRFAVRRVLRSLKPALVIVMETEIWPNLYRETRRSGAGLLVINGRISDKALPSYRRWAWFFRHALSFPNAILAQDSTAAARYRELGAVNPIPAGNLKYDFDPATTSITAPVTALLRRLAPGHVWIAASTMPPADPGDPDEDDIVLDAFQSIPGRHLLILVPRRPERFDSAAAKLAARGIAHLRRSQLTDSSTLTLPAVLLLDTIGELSGLFRIAHAVFMGGTFPHRGGHNILEPAAFGVPIVTGPHMENFAEIAAAFRTAGAVLTIEDPAALAPAIQQLFADPSIGEKGRVLSDQQRGATARALAHIHETYDQALVRPPSFNPLSHLWLAGMAVDRWRKRRHPDIPAQPVISVGNLSMGGTGKTPFVLWLAQQLAREGHKPGVLMRGYRAAPGQDGEEAALIRRAGHAVVGVGADRRAARLALERSAHPDVLLLDDGFQHWQTRRDLDIVLIDAIDPFRGGVFPRGLLREPFPALARAHVVIITRTDEGRAYQGLFQEIRRHNPTAPVFLARVVADPPPVTAAGAFCGLGQPESFRRTLRDLAIEPMFFEEFPDHHHYQAAELRALAARAPALLTTEKDLLNIEPALAAECRVHAIPMRMVIKGEDRLLALIRESLRKPAEPA
ncbi:MAG: tetraacyldisaccharide 4'-kinase [Bryobacterales bacterium]|nr:tetraacyldisaccharide 4'-kinase [Bryobacterales bacterium]